LNNWCYILKENYLFINTNVIIIYYVIIAHKNYCNYRTRLNGLKAIHSVVSSNSFLISPKIDNYLIVIQPLVENILISNSHSNVNISNVEEAQATINKKRGGGDALELENFALKSISELMQKVTPATFEKIISPIYRYISIYIYIYIH